MKEETTETEVEVGRGGGAGAAQGAGVGAGAGGEIRDHAPGAGWPLFSFLNQTNTCQGLAQEGGQGLAQEGGGAGAGETFSL